MKWLEDKAMKHKLESTHIRDCEYKDGINQSEGNMRRRLHSDSIDSTNKKEPYPSNKVREVKSETFIHEDNDEECELRELIEKLRIKEYEVKKEIERKGKLKDIERRDMELKRQRKLKKEKDRYRKRNR